MNVTMHRFVVLISATCLYFVGTATTHAFNIPASGSPASGSPTAESSSTTQKLIDCPAIIKNRQDTQADPADVTQCINRGADPIAAIRVNDGKSEGVKIGVANGFAVGTANAPENSPRAVNANASVSRNAINFSCKFPPSLNISLSGISMKPGSCLDFVKGLFKDKKGQPGTPTTPVTPTIDVNPSGSTPGNADTAASCAADTDATGVYGAKIALTSEQNPLVCGGAIPLSNYQISLNPNPTALASTENGAYYIWLYQKQQNGSYRLMPNNPLKIPAFLGNWNGVTKTCDNKIKLGAPIAQLISYNNTSQSIALRLTSKGPEVAGVTTEKESEDALFYDEKNVEKFLVIPVISGVPKIPEECAPPTDYYKPIQPTQTDITINMSPALLCELSPEQCALTTSSSTGTSSCDLVNILPSGEIQTSVGAVNCAGKILYSVLNRPNLIFNPGSTPVSSTIEGRSAVMMGALPGSKIYAPTDTVFQVGTNAPRFILNDGGTLGMTDNSRLKMRGPATINPQNASVTLTNGGQLLSPTGSVLRDIAAGSSYTPPNPILPLTFTVGRSMEMPAGYQIPTQPNPYVRLPLDAAQ